MEIPWDFCLGICLGNFIYAFFAGRDWDAAVERSFLMCLLILSYVLTH